MTIFVNIRMLSACSRKKNHIFIFPLLSQKKELSDYKCRIKVRYKNFERSDGKSSSRGGGFRRRAACTYFHIPLLSQKKELSDYKCRIKVKSTKI